MFFFYVALNVLERDITDENKDSEADKVKSRQNCVKVFKTK